MAARGKFIILEGGEGSGKTTMGERLKVEFPEIVYTQDPGGTPLGERMRDLLMRDETAGIDTRAELLLFLAGRAQLIAEVIKPALNADKHVVSNRFGLSSIIWTKASRTPAALQSCFSRDLAGMYARRLHLARCDTKNRRRTHTSAPRNAHPLRQRAPRFPRTGSRRAPETRE
ncbi:dTMP kinase [Candidatus Kaiserbacteria bacterium]|nr:dTMP kinase [Candidatus Kaiserbacteria bacterium]